MIRILRQMLVSELGFLLHPILPSRDFLSLLFRVVRFTHILWLALLLVRFRITFARPILVFIAVEKLELPENAFSALFAVEDVFLEVADSGVFGREELPFRLVRDPLEFVSQVVVCSNYCLERIEFLSDDVRQESFLLLVFVYVLPYGN